MTLSISQDMEENMIYTFAFYLLLFFSGASLASFMALVGYRLPQNQSIIFPRSHCDTCDHSLSPLNLIPVFSYFICRGRCRFCRSKITPLYFIAEIIGGLAFLLCIGSDFFDSPDKNILFLTVLFLSISLSIADIYYFVLPDPLIFTFIFLILTQSLYFQNTDFWKNLIASIFIFIVFYLLYNVFEDKMGGGDIKLITALTLVLGMIPILYVVLLASLGGLFTFLYCYIKKKELAAIPFGPYLLGAALIVMLIIG